MAFLTSISRGKSRAPGGRAFSAKFLGPVTIRAQQQLRFCALDKQRVVVVVRLGASRAEREQADPRQFFLFWYSVVLHVLRNWRPRSYICSGWRRWGEKIVCHLIAYPWKPAAKVRIHKKTSPWLDYNLHCRIHKHKKYLCHFFLLIPLSLYCLHHLVNLSLAQFDRSRMYLSISPS